MSERHFVFRFLVLRLVLLLVGLLGCLLLGLCGRLGRHFLLYVYLLFRLCRPNLVAMLGSEDLTFSLLHVLCLG